MTSTIGVLVILVVVGFSGYAGYRDGIFFTAYALMRNLIGFLCAMSFYEALTRVFEGLISDTPMAHKYFLLISLALIMAAVFILGRWLKVQYTVPNVPCTEYADRIGGPVIGVFNGVVVTGFLLIAWSMLPFAKYIPGDYGRLQIKSGVLDTGAMMLRYYKYAEERMGGSTPFLLQDEPVTGDLNQNGRGDPGEEFVDANRNGQWDRGWLWKYKNQASITWEDLEGLPGFETE